MSAQHGHAQFSDKTYNKIMDECQPHLLEGRAAVPPGSNCSAAMDEMTTEIGGYYGYKQNSDTFSICCCLSR